MEEVKNVITDENDVIIDMTEDIAEHGSRKGLKIAGGIGIAAGVGFLAYKFAIKPIIGKIKDKREKKKNAGVIKIVDDEHESDDDDTESFEED